MITVRYLYSASNDDVGTLNTNTREETICLRWDQHTEELLHCSKLQIGNAYISLLGYLQVGEMQKYENSWYMEESMVMLGDGTVASLFADGMYVCEAT